MTLHPPDIHYYRAAEGWLELGDPAEASRELERIQPAHCAHPLVLMVRWKICAKDSQWPLAVEIAQTLVDLAPEKPFGWIHRSFALHELHQTQEALDKLLPAARRFPGEPLIPYYLACYACRLGRMGEAKTWLGKAFEVGDHAKVRAMALEDSDLRPIWDQV